MRPGLFNPLTWSSLQRLHLAAQVALSKGLGHQYQSGMLWLAGDNFHLEHCPLWFTQHFLRSDG